MSSVDPEGALRMYSQAGDWEKCLELAEKQGGPILAKYVALYAAELIKTSAPLSALQLFAKYGAPANPQVCTHTHTAASTEQLHTDVSCVCTIRISTSTRGCVWRCMGVSWMASVATPLTLLLGTYCLVWYGRHHYVVMTSL